MKCYFALSDDVSDDDIYYSMFICALESAKKNTSLNLHCLYDFRKKCCERVEDDRIYKLLKKYNVSVHIISIDFESDLLAVYNDEYLKKINVKKNSLYSRFLRFMLSDVEKDDEYILYADTDLIFMKDIKLSDFSVLPATVGVCPEFDNCYDYKYFNAGVMLVNVASYKDAKTKLVDALKKRQYAKIECCDQGYLNLIYENKFVRMDNKFNWKPYWGINHDAVIVHLHGLKPRIDFSKIECTFIDFVSHLMFKNKYAKEGWFYYFNLFASYTDGFVDPQIVATNLLVTMENQNPNYFSLTNRIKRKLVRIFK